MTKPTVDRHGATTGRGRPGSSSARRSAPRPRSSGARWSDARARASSTGRPSSGWPSAGSSRAPGALSPDELRRTRARLRRRRWPASCRPCRAALGTRAAGRRRALGRRRPGRLGPRQHRVVRVADRQARARPARPGRAGRRRADRRGDGARQPLDHDPSARGAARASWASACSASTTSRCYRPRPRPAGCCSSRRTSARPPAASACRSTRSGPGSRSTRRPMPSSSRRTRGCGRTSRRASSGSSACSAATSGAWVARRSAGLGRALRGEGGGEHWIERLMSDEQKALFRETQAVMSLLEGFSDYVMDEVGHELVPDVERIRAKFDERRAQAHAVRAGDAPADRDGPQARAVQEGRDVRPRRRRRRADRRRSTGCGTGRRACRATVRSRRPSAGSRASSTASPTLPAPGTAT